MRRSLCVLGLLVVGWTSGGAAQDSGVMPTRGGAKAPAPVGRSTVAPLDRLVTVDVRNAPIAEVVQSIDEQAGLGLAYSDQVLPGEKRVTMHVRNVPARRALEEALKGTGVAVRTSSTGVLILAKEPVKKAMAPDDSGTVGVVWGRVADSVTSQPIVGAVVTVRGTSLAATTNEQGMYLLREVPVGVRMILVRHLGYMLNGREVAVVEGQRVRADFALKMGMTRLQEVVTTATGARRRMDVPNDVTMLDVDSIVATQPVSSVTELLATRVPGLTVQHTSGAPGDPARLRLRGVNSISRTNDPVVIVDGVRVYYDQSSSRAGNLTGRTLTGVDAGDRTIAAAPSPLDQLDVNSIETVEVFKGPSATSLYGPDAANGVIVVTTKKGRPGPARWSVSASQGLSYMPGRYPNAYLLWGHDYDGRVFACPLNDNCGAGVDSLIQFQALNAPDLTILGHGSSTRAAVGVSGGTTGLTYSITGSADDQTGILELPSLDAERFQAIHGYAPPSWMRRPQTLSRWSATGAVAAQLGPTIDASLTTTLTRENQQHSSMEAQLTALMTTYVDRASDTYYEVGSLGNLRSVEALVPDFYRRLRDAATNFTNAATLNWRPRSWLTTSVNAGVNAIARTDEVLVPKGMLDTLGSLASARGSSVMSTVNVQATATAPLRWGFRFQFATGANYSKTAISDLRTSVSGLASGTTGLNGAAKGDLPSETVTDATNLGWYAAPSISHKRIFLDMGLRFDGASTYGTRVKLPTFPKFGGSWLISDESWFPFKAFVNTLRLRAAYGHAGVQPGITERLRLYKGAMSWIDGGFTDATTIGDSTLGNTQLKPERSTELEGGFDADLWDDRVSVSLSGYRKIRKDALLQVPVAPSVYGDNVRVWKNIGVVRNTGFEATVTTQLVRTDPVMWSWTLGVSRNRNMVVSLAPGMEPITLSYGQRIAAGYPLFGRWAKPIKGYQDVNGDGIIQSREVQVGDSLVFMGETVPNYTASLHTTVSLLRRAVTISAALDYADGVTQSNQTVKSLRALVRAANDRTAPLGEQAAVAALDRTEYGLVQTVSTLRFNSLSVAYNARPSIARRFGASSLSLALQGTNLGLHTNYSGKDPDVNAYTTGNGVVDTGVLPMPRTWSLKLTAGF